MKSLGSRVQAARQDKGMTLDDLHALADLSVGYLSDLENDKRNPSVRNIIKISDVLEVSVEWLIRGRTSKPITCPFCKGKGKLPSD